MFVVFIVVVIIIFIIWTSENAIKDKGLGSYLWQGDQIELFWPRVKSYVELVRADPNIPNGILSTGDNLKCLKRLRPAQQHSTVLQIQIWR